jgi:hypothetical protein
VRAASFDRTVLSDPVGGRFDRTVLSGPAGDTVMSGIVFFATEDEARVVEFYRERVGATVWLEQDGCTILNHDAFKFGFCERDHTDDCSIVTFYYPDREAVDAMYDELADCARGPPVENDQYDVYQFFADDPDGRTVECQTFRHDLPETEPSRR